MSDVEFWTWLASEPARIADFARRAEAQGWDGVGAGDSQSRTGDPYVRLAFAAAVTDTLGLATSVTNPVTRHASVTATAAFTIQRLSRGRMVVGIGRGDSALAHLGRAPARLKWFEAYLGQLQTYLSGGEVGFDESNIPDEAAPLVDRLSLAKAPEASSIRWAGDEPDEPKVPVEVAATGPRVIGIAARQADRIMLAVGADPQAHCLGHLGCARGGSPRRSGCRQPQVWRSRQCNLRRRSSRGPQAWLLLRRVCSLASPQCTAKRQVRPTTRKSRSFVGCTTATT